MRVTTLRRLVPRGVALITMIIVLVVIDLYTLRLNSMDNTAHGPPLIQRDVVTPTSKAEEMRQRTEHLRSACVMYPKRRIVKAVLSSKPLFYLSDRHKLSYCRVAKVGSTFWTQVFLSLHGVNRRQGKQDADDTVFDLPRDAAHGKMKQHGNITTKSVERLNGTTSFLVARSPYSRLFSSYIDQIYLPNKWNIARSMGIKGDKCGNNVTFGQFLMSISSKILDRKLTDLHWAPIYSICMPCDYKIDMVAKQETFNDDVEYILDKANVEQHIRDEVNKAINEQNLIEHSLQTLVGTYVTKGHHRPIIPKGCVSEKELARRIWHAFQIQGYIHNDVEFPEREFNDVTEEETEARLQKAVNEAVERRKLSGGERAAQRHAWMVKFWKGVSSEVLKMSHDAYYEDFFMFGYDIDPSIM
ncbi:carbohydrate sulfotransferase 12-like [Mya arenaria]|uniref:carbohydrate sulfotransferase 12-like n=1 Tax=Mya arenaria TaxID=6604 RepID=UPI0022E044B1|nr:carbohydrate sulfotransferase 12-like [Mya arenaria]